MYVLWGPFWAVLYCWDGFKCGWVDFEYMEKEVERGAMLFDEASGLVDYLPERMGRQSTIHGARTSPLERWHIP